MESRNGFRLIVPKICDEQKCVHHRKPAAHPNDQMYREVATSYISLQQLRVSKIQEQSPSQRQRPPA
jgi:hypothetical protein